MQAKLRETKEELRRRRHLSIPEQGQWLRQVVTGFYAYHAVPMNIRALAAFRDHVTRLWWQALRRRSQRDKTRGNDAQRSPTNGFPNPKFFIRGHQIGLPSNIRGGSRMRESRTYGSVRGALSNGRPYRDRLALSDSTGPAVRRMSSLVVAI
jgi:hypothetical protein